jgi:hypothetical protein
MERNAEYIIREETDKERGRDINAEYIIAEKTDKERGRDINANIQRGEFKNWRTRERERGGGVICCFRIVDKLSSYAISFQQFAFFPVGDNFLIFST